MSARAAIALLLVALVGWWYSPVSPRPARAPAYVGDAAPPCPPPPRVRAGAPPLQSPVPASLAPIRLRAATLTPVAGFSIEARVLSTEAYRTGREADLSPLDLALGWARMADDDVLSRLDIDQGARFFTYRYADAPPLPPDEIVRSAANLHVIPSNDRVAAALKRVRADQRVRVDGWLVNADAGDGWAWRSSTTREDTGAGACELVYVCDVTVL